MVSFHRQHVSYFCVHCESSVQAAGSPGTSSRSHSSGSPGLGGGEALMQILAQVPWQQTGESLAHCVSAEQMLGLAGVPRTSEQRSDMDAALAVRAATRKSKHGQSFDSGE